MVLAALAASVGGAGAHAAPASGPVPEPFGGLAPRSTEADRDADRVFDALERRLDGLRADRAVHVLVALDRPATPGFVDDLAAATGIVPQRAFSLVNAVAASATADQIRALARDPRVVHVEGGASASAFDVSAEASFGTARARLQVPGLDGDRDGDPGSFTPADLVAAVVDTGIDPGHADLDGGKVLGFADCRDLVAGCQAASPADDPLFGHGTHVAATLAGDHGVAPGAGLVGVRVLDPLAPSTSDKARMLAGIQWVVAHRAQLGIEVLNLSIGIPVDGPQGEGCSAGTDLLSQAVEAAVAAGLVVVTAAGNSGPGACTIGAPAAAPSAITVGNIADLGAAGEAEGRPILGFRLHVWSSRGPTADGRTKPDLVAPGVEITSAAAGTTNGSWDGTGTSAAAPFVAGTALLVLDAAPALTPGEVKAVLVGSAVDWGPPGPDPDYGAGRLDAFAAVRGAGAPTAGPPAVPLHQVLTGHLEEGASRDVPLNVTDTAYPLAATLLVPAATTAASPNLDLELRDPGGALVASSTRVPGASPEPGWPVWSGRQEDLGVMPAAEGTYTLRVTALAGAADYVLDVSRGPAPPVAQTAPSVTGDAVEGSVLVGTAGAWEGSPWTLSSIWLRCPDGEAPCQAIDGATATTYTASPADVGSRLLYRTTAANGAAAVDADAPLVDVVSGRPPALVGPPSIAGDPKVGGTVTADPGVWSGTPPLTYRIRWLRCGPEPPDDCVPTGAEGAQLTPDGLVDQRLRVLVTATNACTPGCGSADATSAATEPVAGLPPQAAVAITGLARVGETLTASTEQSALGVPAGQVESYRWSRCPESGPCEGVQESSGTSPGYTVAPADLGFRLTAHVVIRNTCLRGCGASEADSAPTQVVVPPLPPAAGTPPSVSGTPRDGQVLTAADGAWSGFGPIALERQWRRCDAGGGNCVDLAGETGPTLALGPDDVGGTIRVRVRATNLGGSTVADSAPSPVVTARPPAATRPPAVLGTPRRDVELRVDYGSWDGTGPLEFAVDWLRCRTTCVPLGRHGDRYVPTAADVGARLKVRVTASNAAGSLAESSAQTAPVAPARPRVGTAGADELTGTPWDDVIRGGGGNDRIRGLAGPDDLGGGAGADRIDGGSGRDRIAGGSGQDRLAGGPGADRIDARDGVRDVVSCGPGRDVATVDRADVTTGCERVKRPPPGRRPLL